MNTHLQRLRDRRSKITPLRQALLEIFHKNLSSLGADELHTMVRKKIPRAGLQSIYRNLADFTKAGIVEAVHLGQRQAVYALCRGASRHHHHAVCRKCGSSVEVDVCGLSPSSRRLGEALSKIKKETGFLVERHSLTLEGLCRDCRKV